MDIDQYIDNLTTMMLDDSIGVSSYQLGWRAIRTGCEKEVKAILSPILHVQKHGNDLVIDVKVYTRIANITNSYLYIAGNYTVPYEINIQTLAALLDYNQREKEGL